MQWNIMATFQLTVFIVRGICGTASQQFMASIETPGPVISLNYGMQ